MFSYARFLLEEVLFSSKVDWIPFRLLFDYHLF